jgi:hypothetical protein
LNIKNKNDKKNHTKQIYFNNNIDKQAIAEDEWRSRQ